MPGIQASYSLPFFTEKQNARSVTRRSLVVRGAPSSACECNDICKGAPELIVVIQIVASRFMASFRSICDCVPCYWKETQHPSNCS